MVLSQTGAESLQIFRSLKKRYRKTYRSRMFFASLNSNVVSSEGIWSIPDLGSEIKISMPQIGDSSFWVQNIEIKVFRSSLSMIALILDQIWISPLKLKFHFWQEAKATRCEELNVKKRGLPNHFVHIPSNCVFRGLDLKLCYGKSLLFLFLHLKLFSYTSHIVGKPMSNGTRIAEKLDFL